MSWTRWGSPCDGSFPPHPKNDECKDCPGSDVYVYESEDGYCCCGCRYDFPDCKTSDEMKEHLRFHVKQGDHVRPSLLLTDEEWLNTLPLDWHSLACDCDRCKQIPPKEL